VQTVAVVVGGATVLLASAVLVTAGAVPVGGAGVAVSTGVWLGSGVLVAEATVLVRVAIGKVPVTVGNGVEVGTI
jgi:hypothetical protein